MERKRTVSLVLALTLAVGMFSGCGEKQRAPDSEGNEYVPGKELNITVWNAQGTDHIKQDSSAENIPLDWLKEKTKVNVENIYGNDGGQWDTKLSRLIAGDSLPEVFYVAGGQGPSHFKKLHDAKKVYTLSDELLKEYAPNVWNRVPDEYWELMTVDGQILGIPFGFSRYDEETHPNASAEELEYMQKTYGTQIVSNNVGIYIRDDISKKLWPESRTYDEMCAEIDATGEKIGKKLWDIPINSTEEYIQMFRDINAMNLTENGKKVYPFGYNGGDLWLPFTYLGASMYGYATNNYITSWNPVTQEIFLPLFEGTVKESAKIQNQLIREGIFDPESLVQTSANFTENVLNGIYAVTCVDYAGGMTKVNRQLKELGKDFRYRPLTVNVPQNENYPLQYYQAPWTAAICLTTMLEEDEVKQVLNWINTMFSDEFEEILWWGTPEDGLYTEENGVRKYTDDRFNKRYIDDDASALSVTECKGIGSLVYSPECEFYITAGFWPERSRWNPKVMQNITKITSASGDGFGASESAEGASLRPQSDVFDAPYANVPECVEFWAKREQWESQFKIALAADSEEEFEKQWKAAEDNMRSITDVDKMVEEMTKIAKVQAEELGIAK